MSEDLHLAGLRRDANDLDAAKHVQSWWIKAIVASYVEASIHACPVAVITDAEWVGNHCIATVSEAMRWRDWCR